uniref:Uncharacterized protein n=1 Tax=Eptatretus burgeri TaxID=7764 RepID=A0A8C4NP12_EPTBU
MGCGDSRVELFEGRRNDSLTKDTESTWITSTDGETTVSYTYTAAPEASGQNSISLPQNNIPIQGLKASH